MIPRVRPSYTRAELRAAFPCSSDAVVHFEQELATHFGIKHAIAFPYGRSAIYAAFRALGLRGKIVQPAYNCVVVAHATVLSDNQPTFVDCQRDDPNQDVDGMISAVEAETVAVMPTSIFGMTFDAPALVAAIRRKNRRALILMDCAQCFDAHWRGELLATQGDAAILAFGIGKPMTTLFGGAFLTNRDDLAKTIRDYRARSFHPPSIWHSLNRVAYFVASWCAVTGPNVILMDWLERSGALEARFLSSLRSRRAIQLPRDHQTHLDEHQAEIGRAQLRRVSAFIRRRREISILYARALSDQRAIELPNWNSGSTHAIYALRLTDPARRANVIAMLRQSGVQSGTVLDYVIPDLEFYVGSSSGGEYPHARDWAQHVLNLPNHPTLSDAQVEQCASALRRALAASQSR